MTSPTDTLVEQVGVTPTGRALYRRLNASGEPFGKAFCHGSKRIPKPLTYEQKLRKKLTNAYLSMLRRCRPGSQDHQKYAGRGIGVCEAWATDREQFYSHIGLPPSLESQVDRIDNDRGYEPGNVRWVTPRENARNTRRGMITINGVTKHRWEWLEQYGVDQTTYVWRVAHGWTRADAITTPVKQYGTKSRKVS